MSYIVYSAANVFVPQVTTYLGSPPPPPPAQPPPVVLRHQNITYIGGPMNVAYAPAAVSVSMPVMQTVTTTVPFATFAVAAPPPPAPVGVYAMGLPLHLAP